MFALEKMYRLASSSFRYHVRQSLLLDCSQQQSYHDASRHARNPIFSSRARKRLFLKFYYWVSYRHEVFVVFSFYRGESSKIHVIVVFAQSIRWFMQYVHNTTYRLQRSLKTTPRLVRFSRWQCQQEDDQLWNEPIRSARWVRFLEEGEELRNFHNKWHASQHVTYRVGSSVEVCSALNK